MSSEVLYFKKLPSTNEKAKELNKEIVIIAQEQTKGRGRFKRAWSSGKGGVYLSIALKPKILKINYLTFMAAIAAQKAIKKITSLQTKIKWPNDLNYKNKKLCGILTESKLGKENLVVIGIGINTNNRLPKKLENKAAALKKILNKKIDNKRIISEILKRFALLYKQYKNKEFREITAQWKKLNNTLNRDIKAITKNKIYAGKAIDIDKDCNLIIKLGNNKTKKIIEGDIVY